MATQSNTTQNKSAQTAAQAQSKSTADKIVHYQNGTHGSLVLASGKRITFPYVTSDADELAEIKGFIKNHPALVIEPVSEYEARLTKQAEEAAKAVTAAAE